MPPPRSKDDVTDILSSFSILRGETIATLVVDGGSGRFEAWGGSSPTTTDPLYSWNISTFFDADQNTVADPENITDNTTADVSADSNATTTAMKHQH
jgi:hypothetical protein